MVQTLAKRVINPIIDAVIYIHSKVSLRHAHASIIKDQHLLMSRARTHGNFIHQGFVHRDLKPENILLDYQGTSMDNFTIKVCDFGLCEKVPADNRLLTGK